MSRILKRLFEPKIGRGIVRFTFIGVFTKVCLILKTEFSAVNVRHFIHRYKITELTHELQNYVLKTIVRLSRAKNTNN